MIKTFLFASVMQTRFCLLDATLRRCANMVRA